MQHFATTVQTGERGRMMPVRDTHPRWMSGPAYPAAVAPLTFGGSTAARTIQYKTITNCFWNSIGTSTRSLFPPFELLFIILHILSLRHEQSGRQACQISTALSLPPLYPCSREQQNQETTLTLLPSSFPQHCTPAAEFQNWLIILTTLPTASKQGLQHCPATSASASKICSGALWTSVMSWMQLTRQSTLRSSA